MLEKLLSARFIAMVLVIATLCALTIIVVLKCFLNPEAFSQLKDLTLALIVAFTGAVSTVINAYFSRSDRKSEELQK
jgi:membrane associated rhomboid family serine protease